MKIFTLWIGEKTKPIPGFGRKSEARNPKRVEWVLFEKTKPIYRRDISAYSVIRKGIMAINRSAGHEKNKANQSQFRGFAISDRWPG